MTIDFTPGSRWKNRIGWYEVLELLPKGKLRARYDEADNEVILDLTMQRQIISNIEQEYRLEQSRLVPHADTARNRTYFETIGFLARCAYLEAFVAPQSRGGFEKNYTELTGVGPIEGETPGYHVHHHSSKWGAELRISFPGDSDIDFDFGGLQAVAGTNAGQMRLNNNAYWYKLVALGFRLGGEQDTASIAANIPDAYRDDFFEGASSDPGSVASIGHPGVNSPDPRQELAKVSDTRRFGRDLQIGLPCATDGDRQYF